MIVNDGNTSVVRRQSSNAAAIMNVLHSTLDEIDTKRMYGTGVSFARFVESFILAAPFEIKSRALSKQKNRTSYDSTSVLLKCKK